MIDGYGFSKMELRKTSSACPEQYILLIDDEPAGYFRLRHGFFRVDYPQCGGETLYEAEPQGDGMFMDEERGKYLSAGIAACINRHRAHFVH